MITMMRIITSAPSGRRRADDNDSWPHLVESRPQPLPGLCKPTEFRHVQRIPLNEIAAQFHDVTHQVGKDFCCRVGVALEQA